MTREELTRQLTILVRRGQLTTDEARQVLAAFDAGRIPDVSLPLPAAQALQPASEDSRGDMWLWLLLLLGLGRATPRINRAQARRAHLLLAERFERTVTQAAQTAAASLATWQRRMARTVSDYTLAQATAGARQPLNDTQLGRVQAANRRNLAFLALFAVQAMARSVLGRPLTVPGIANRSRLYGGMGWAQFDRAAEDGLGRGWIARYISQDSPTTCDICSSYHDTVWLPGDGPFPGEICRGASRCKCRRELEYSPSEYRRLGGVF